MADVTQTQGGVRNGAASSGDASVAELVKQLSEQTSRLARLEVELAKTELTEKGKQAGIGAGMFGGAGVVGFYTLGALIATAILGLSKAIGTAWVAGLIVTVVLGVVAGVLALAGKNKVQNATPPVPEQATESVKEDVQMAKAKAQAGRG